MSCISQELQHFPGVWASTDDGFSVMISISGFTDALAICIYSSSNEASYKQEFDESDLYKVRSRIGENISWPKFFNALVYSMQNNKIEVKSIKRINNSMGNDMYYSNSNKKGSDNNNFHVNSGNYLHLTASASASASLAEDEVTLLCYTNVGGRPITFNATRTTENVQMIIL